jgi:glycosyltransferase involved in cell wall biosynthesis
MRILQVTPCYFADSSVIGGGERGVNYLCRTVGAVSRVGEVRCDMLSFAQERAVRSISPGTDLHILPGLPDEPASFATPAFHALIAQYDVIHVHQCLSQFGLFVAARARLAGKRVIGSDHGGGEWGDLEAYPVIGDLFDVFHAQSDFACHAFTFFNRPVAVIKGPMDETAFPLGTLRRDPKLIVALGRILTHKGFEHIIEALPASCTLVIVGRPYDGGYLDYLRGRVGTSRVTFETDLDDAALLRLLQSAGLHVHASHHVNHLGQFALKPELLGLAPLECMATGLPAVTSRAGSLGEFEALVGCRTYGTQRELNDLLRAHADGRLFDCSPDSIRQDVVATYGLRAFGTQYLALLRSLSG